MMARMMAVRATAIILGMVIDLRSRQADRGRNPHSALASRLPRAVAAVDRDQPWFAP
jgi:hypothetical protein